MGEVVEKLGHVIGLLGDAGEVVDVIKKIRDLVAKGRPVQEIRTVLEAYDATPLDELDLKGIQADVLKKYRLDNA